MSLLEFYSNSSKLYFIIPLSLCYVKYLIAVQYIIQTIEIQRSALYFFHLNYLVYVFLIEMNDILIPCRVKILNLCIRCAVREISDFISGMCNLFDDTFSVRVRLYSMIKNRKAFENLAICVAKQTDVRDYWSTYKVVHKVLYACVVV